MVITDSSLVIYVEPLLFWNIIFRRDFTVSILFDNVNEVNDDIFQTFELSALAWHIWTAIYNLVGCEAGSLPTTNVSLENMEVNML